MSQTTILVIDDSATIRRLVDSTLSQAGYRVILATNAEDGLAQARSAQPDLILLDHQLPGTTGFAVCQQLVQMPGVMHTPVVISSTLRKKAYVEYADMSNVVDMLPKPYTEDLLITTVANALDTGRLIVQSQAQGTAVPEVIQALEDSDLAGTFKMFSLREVLDFLNNGVKTGVVEVEAAGARIWFYVDEGRLQAVLSTGVDPGEIIAALPDSLRELAPILSLTVGGRLCSEVDGLVELLDHKVLDPRLLRMVLRHQAAMLVWRCFRSQPKGFRFESGRVAPPLFSKLPLDVSLAALLVEGALRCDESELPENTPDTAYIRRAIRGQNLDRAGLTAQHMKVLGAVAEPISVEDLANKLDWSAEEVRRVLHGLTLAELVERQEKGKVRQVFALEADLDVSRELRRGLQKLEGKISAKVVRDRLALQLLLRRSRPDVLVLPLSSRDDIKYAAGLQQQLKERMSGVRLIGVVPGKEGAEAALKDLPVTCTAVLRHPFSAEAVVRAIEQSLAATSTPRPTRQPELAGTAAS